MDDDCLHPLQWQGGHLHAEPVHHQPSLLDRRPGPKGRQVHDLRVGVGDADLPRHRPKRPLVGQAHRDVATGGAPNVIFQRWWRQVGVDHLAGRLHHLVCGADVVVGQLDVDGGAVAGKLYARRAHVEAALLQRLPLERRTCTVSHRPTIPHCSLATSIARTVPGRDLLGSSEAACSRVPTAT